MKNDEQPVVNEKKQSPIKFLLFVFLIVILLGGIGGVYMWQHSMLLKSEKQLSVANKQLSKSKASIKQLSALFADPSTSGHPSDCSKNNYSNTVYSSFNVKPIAGYQIFDEICVGDGPKVSSFGGMVATDSHKTIGYKVRADGNRTFAFGISRDGHSLCIPSKLINPADATTISKELKLPICIS